MKLEEAERLAEGFIEKIGPFCERIQIPSLKVFKAGSPRSTSLAWDIYPIKVF